MVLNERRFLRIRRRAGSQHFKLPIPSHSAMRHHRTVAACANGVLRSLCTPPGSAVVLGGGFMGLVCMQIYKVLGYSVLISDMRDDRLELAKF
jgi:threonine dehydrogenase-like Zn-dependent dehydrogenase